LKTDVVVSYIESPARFFVQLTVNEINLENITNAVAVSHKMMLKVHEISEGMAICAQYSKDQNWYRAMVIAEPDVEGYADVLYVDYGNVETVRKIHK